MIMPNQPTLDTIPTTWILSPIADLLIAVAVVGYLAMMIRHRRAGNAWPVRRLVSWLAAALFLILAVNSALAVYGHQLFWVHMIGHLILIMVVPALAVWAQPIRLLHDAGGPRLRHAVDRVTKNRAFRILTSPGITLPIYAAVLVLTHLTGFQEAMAQHMWIHHSEVVLYLVAGYLLFLPLLGDELTGRAPIAPFLRFVVLAICMGPDTLVGVALMMTGTAIAPAYAASRDWGPSALADQSAAGAIMWFAGDGLMMVLMVVVAGQLVSAGDRAVSLGPWLDRIRTQSTLGADADPSTNIDDDQAALDAYNARLAALNGMPARRVTVGKAGTENTFHDEP